MSASTLNATYLVTHKSFAFSTEPEIFLLLQNDTELFGVCVNQYSYRNPPENGKSPINLVSDHIELFRQHGHKLTEEDLRYPIFSGGNDSIEDLYVLHTGYKDARNTREFLKNFYYLTSLSDFLSSVNFSEPPYYFSVIRGRKNFDFFKMSMALLADHWEQRSGFHAMAYGVNLDEKYKYSHLLHKSEKTSEVIGEHDVGSIFSAIWSNFFPEAMSAVARTGVAGYLLSQGKFSVEEVHQIVRMAIAISEAEGNDLSAVMRKYTHAEIVQKYDSFLKGGFTFNILKQFDQRTEMLENIGLNSIGYDQHLAKSFIASNHDTAKPQPNKVRKGVLERTLDKLIGIIKRN